MTLSRRRFLASAGAALSFPHISAIAAPGKPGANDRLALAHIGVGGMGSNHLRQTLKFERVGTIHLAALCDVDEKRLADAVAKCGPGVDVYRDYRYILERDDIDAVVIATPDHWHAVQTVQACESGKHVYVEKPTSVTINDGETMIAATKKYNRVVQVGSQARSAEPAHQACTYIRNGMLGKVHKVTCWHRLNPTGGTDPDREPPAELDWDLWLGPLRWRPYNSAYCHGVFRWVMESGGGVIRDRGAHVMSVIRWCLDADEQMPVTIEAKGYPPNKGIWDCPPTMEVVYTFKDPDWQLIWAQPGDRQSNYPDKNDDFGMVFHGEDDTLVLDRDGTRYDAPEKARNFRVPAGGAEVYRMDKYADYNMNHKEDWLQAIRTGATPCMDIEKGHRTATMCNLGNLSYLLGRTLRWDAKKQEVVDDPYANRLLSKPQRHPYHL
jgi:predicted dehydrogenase